MQFEQVLELVREVSKAGLSNFEYVEGNLKIVMSCPEVQQGSLPAAVQPVQVVSSAQTQPSVSVGQLEAPASQAVENTSVAQTVTTPQPAAVATQDTQAAASQAPTVKAGNEVKSPLVGTFYTAPSEDAPSFVKVGDTVKKGQVLAIVEAMKLMNEIESDFDGVVTEILVENAQAVEFGQPLFVIA